MKSIYSLFLEADVLGVEASLFVKNGSKTNKNIFGGIISILMACLITAGTLFFVLDFLNRKNFNLIANFEDDPNVSYRNFHETPFMIRLSGNTGRIIPNNYYNVRLNLGIFDEAVNSTHVAEKVDLEPCDIKKHLVNYTSLFKDIKEVNSYFCPIWQRKFDIQGIYGSTNFSYLHFNFSPCVNNNCPNKKSLDSALSVSYLDLITITNQIKHDNIHPKEKILFKTRVSVSNTIFKRIWIYFDKVNYITDFGYIFEERNLEVFNNIKGYSVDVDLRNVKNASFLWVDFVNNSQTTTFSRSYMKAQELLANIGGIIKGLTVCGMLITYSISIVNF